MSELRSRRKTGDGMEAALPTGDQAGNLLVVGASPDPDQRNGWDLCPGIAKAVYNSVGCPGEVN